MKRYQSPDQIRVGVIGYGGAFNMGREHLNGMKRAGMTPAAVAELDPKRLEVAEQDFPGIATFTSVAAMLRKKDLDLITVITPHNTHAKLGLQILKAGKHAVLEKPMAVTTAECTAMIDEAKRRKLVVSTYHNRHWDGWILKAVEMVGSGAVGDIVRIDLRFGGYEKPRNWWRSSRSISGGILYDWGVHLLEYALQLAKSDIVDVAGYAFEGFWAGQQGHPYPKDANEDEAHAVVRLKSGARIHLTISSVDMSHKKGFVQVVGTKGVYTIDWGHWELEQPLEDGSRKVSSGRHHESQGHLFYQNIADHLVKGEKLIISGEWARRPIHILDLAAQSARKGQSLKAKFA